MNESTIQLINDGGVVVMALVVLFAGALALHKGWIVMGSQYRLVMADKDRLAEKLETVSTKAEQVSERQQEASKQQVDQLLKTLASQRETIHTLVTREVADA